ncbi:hypothetical protein [Pseudomonas fluorescens]|uniref:hypothetical protein n=1 Tax=Pseudomonas fluorescens TaxID=294 RepID=UPI00123F916F|nr:hypothetical protein [Pseudomonas fluorescens]
MRLPLQALKNRTELRAASTDDVIFRFSNAELPNEYFKAKLQALLFVSDVVVSFFISEIYLLDCSGSMF